MLSSGGILNIDHYTLKLIILFSIGALVMRGAGCIVNDLWDIKYDRAVERTRTRPLASGEIRPYQAIIFMACLVLTGLMILIRLPPVTILLGFLSIPLIIVYPLTKRWIWWPQAVLGLTFNFGALMGWSATNDILEPPALLMYAAGFFWTLGYDTIYAHQDKEDDELVGVKSSALFLKEKSKKWIAIFYSLTITLLIATGIFAKAAPGYFTVLTVAGFMLFRQVKNWDINDNADSLKRFRSNRDFGLIVALAMAL